MIEFKNFSVTYQNETVLDIENLGIAQHKAIVLIGPSGCGKTTLLLALANLLPSKAICRGDLSLANHPTINVVFQDYGLFPWKTVEENILLPLKMKGALSDQVLARASKLIEDLKLKESLKKYPKALSGGQKQRVSLARAWLMNSDLLLLDEPFSALDAITREALQDQVKNMQMALPKTQVLVTHSIEEAVFLGQTIVLMTPSGKVAEVIENETYKLTEARTNPAFYDKCIEVRSKLKAVQV